MLFSSFSLIFPQFPAATDVKDAALKCSLIAVFVSILLPRLLFTTCARLPQRCDHGRVGIGGWEIVGGGGLWIKGVASNEFISAHKR